WPATIAGFTSSAPIPFRSLRATRTPLHQYSRFSSSLTLFHAAKKRLSPLLWEAIRTASQARPLLHWLVLGFARRSWMRSTVRAVGCRFTVTPDTLAPAMVTGTVWEM